MRRFHSLRFAALSLLLLIGAAFLGVTSPALADRAGCTYSATPVASPDGSYILSRCDTYGDPPATVTDPLGVYKATVTPYGELTVAAEASNKFQDTFDSGVRDANMWAAPTTAGGAVACTWSAGTVTCGTGTTANGYAYMTSVPTFRPTQPGYTRSGFALKIPSVIPANTYAAWGPFTPTTTPTAASPIQEGCAFEIQPGGKEYIACYAGAARTVIQDMSAATGNSTQPTDGITHGFVQDFRGDAMVWYLASYTAGSKDPISLIPIATQQNGVNGPNVNTQPLTILAVAGSSAPASSLTVSVAATWVGTTNTNTWMCDATYSFRCATVKGGSTAPVAADLPLVVALHPNSAAISYSYAHISTSTTTVVKSGAGVLHTLSVNNLGTVASTTTIYDNTSAAAPVVAVINTLAGQTSYLYDVAFNTGLTIVTTGTVAPDVTVAYK